MNLEKKKALLVARVEAHMEENGGRRLEEFLIGSDLDDILADDPLLIAEVKKLRARVAVLEEPSEEQRREQLAFSVVMRDCNK